MTKSIEIAQFAINVFLAVIGVIAICIYGSQLIVQKQQTIDSENIASGRLVIRDYTADFVTAPGYTFPIIRITFTLKNVGGTVVNYINVQEGSGAGNRPLQQSDKIDLHIEPSPNGPSLGLGDTRVITNDYTSGSSTNILAGQEFFRDVVVVGYETVFGRKGAISDCLTYLAGKEKFISCATDKPQQQPEVPN